MDYIKKTLSYKGKVVFEKITMPKFSRIPKIYDQNEACFMFVESGGFNVRSQDVFMKFDEQNALLAKCFNYFFEMDKTQWESTDFITVVGVVFYPFVIEEIFKVDLVASNYQGGYNLKKVKVDPLLHNFKESIDYLLEHPTLADDTLVVLKLREFVQLILRQENNNSILDFFSSLFSPVNYDLSTVVKNNLYANLSLNELAKLCNMSTSTFKRKFKGLYKDTPGNYFLEKKIAKARSLLVHAQYNIGQIAIECGFESISAFNRNFKKHTNLSPSDFRKKVKK